MHVFGRSRAAAHPSWRWGEAPRLPDSMDRKSWTAGFAPLTGQECAAIVKRMRRLLDERYAELAKDAGKGS